MKAGRQLLLPAAIVAVALLAVAIPVLGADPSASPSDAASPAASPSPSALPSPSASPSGDAPSPSNSPTEASAQPAASAEPQESAEPERSAKPDTGPDGAAGKGDEDSGVAVTVTGTVAKGSDGKGRPSYSLTAGGTTWDLSAGPPWYWGDNNPLNAYVGKSVTIAGETEPGDTELDVDTVDGTAIRPDGKPPWAGGPWVVGPSHPGYKDWMAGGKPGHDHAKDKNGAEAAPTPARPG